MNLFTKNGRTSRVVMSEREYEQCLDQMVGICTACGASHDMCEPDTEKRHCGQCGASQVYGLESLLVAGRVDFQ